MAGARRPPREGAFSDFPEPEEILLGVPPRPTLEQEARDEEERKGQLEVERLHLARLMESETFRKWLWSLLTQCGTFQRRYGASPNGFPDRDATEYQRGWHDAGWHIWTLFDDAAPELAGQMRREMGATR